MVRLLFLITFDGGKRYPITGTFYGDEPAMYIIIWEFRPAENRRDDFEVAYGAKGRWAQLFARASGYQGTELVQDAEDGTRYVTIDRWESAQAYAEFRSNYDAEYCELDAACEALTSAEALVGRFHAV